MENIRNIFSGIRADERGRSTVEYVIILVLVAVLGIGVWRHLGETIQAQVGEADTQLGDLNTQQDDG